MSHTEEFLAHFGVKGMKWGKKKNPASTDSARSTDVRAVVKTKGVHTVSNKDLQDAINRMNLEQQFKRLSVNERPAVTRFMASTMLEIGKREVQVAAGKKIAKTVARAVA